MRIVSLLPSATEIVHALGAAGDLVGRSEECDYPASVRSLPVVMRARVYDADRPSREIDARVQRTRGAEESLYHLDVGLLRGLAPDLLLTQDLCGVCSVTEAEVESACRVAGLSPRIVSLTPRRLEDVWATISRVGEAVGRAQEAADLRWSIQHRLGSLRGTPASHPRVAVVEWLDPPILAGLWSPDMVHAAGGEPLGPRSGEPGQRTTWEEIRRLRPDLVVLSPCSFSVDRTRYELVDRHLDRLLAGLRPELGTVVADEAYFSRPGPRLADGVELLARSLRGEPTQGPMPVEQWLPREAQ